jgi:hypothetical protein
MPKVKNEKNLKKPIPKLGPANYSYIRVRVPMKLKKALDKEAKRRGETACAIVREAVEKFLKSG